MAHPLRVGASESHEAWCHELSARRDEFGRSRDRAGITRQVVWLQPDADLAVVRTDAEDPHTALEALATSPEPFDRWYAEQELNVHGRPLHLAGGPPELLADYREGTTDPFDFFVAVALPLLPGQTERYCRAIRANAQSAEASGGADRVRRWGLNRMGIWMQRVGEQDIVVYELAGDIPRMVQILADADGPDMDQQRAFFRSSFGRDFASGDFPVPRPSFAWSSAGADTALG